MSSRFYLKLFSLFLLLSLFSLPTVFADIGGSQETPGKVIIENPLGEDATIATLLSNIIDFIVVISIPILTIVFLYGAFLMLTAGGKEDQFKKGNQTLLYAAIGFAIILIGEGLVKLIEAIIVGDASL